MATKNSGLAIIALFLMGIVAFAAAQDISMMLQNRNLVNRQIGCVLHRRPCDIIGKQIRALLPEALFNNCGRCTPQQVINAKKLIAFMKDKHPNEWQMILKMYSKRNSS